MLRAASQFHLKAIQATSFVAAILAVALIAIPACMAVPLAAALSDKTSKTRNTSGGLAGFDRFAFAVAATHWRRQLPPLDRAVYVANPKETVSTDEPQSLPTKSSNSSRVEKTLAAAEPVRTVKAAESPSTIRARPDTSRRKKISPPRRLGYQRPSSKKARPIKRKPKKAHDRNWKMQALFPDGQLNN